MTVKSPLLMLYLWGVLIALGLIAVSSITVHLSDGWLNPTLIRHVIYVSLSGLALYVAFRIPPHLFAQFHRLAWLLALVLAAVVLAPQVGMAEGGSRRWISFYYFSVQISEVVKPLLLIYIAGYLASRFNAVSRSIVPLIVVLIGVGLVLALVLLEPDFGTVAIMGLVAVGVLFLANARLSHLVLLGGSALVGIGALLYLEPYRVERVMTFLSPWDADIRLNEGYQLSNSLISFGRGEFTGTGLGTGLQKTFTPAPHNDFIFATIAEETGLIGASLVLALLMALVYKLADVARTCLQNRNHYDGLFCYGVALLIGFQALVHVGVNAGLFPTKGLTLPFISFGGNSLIILSALVGMALRIAYENTPKTLK